MAFGSTLSQSAKARLSCRTARSRIEHEAGQRAGLEHADQILGAAGQGQPVEFPLHASGCAAWRAISAKVRKVEARLVRSGVALATSFTRADSRMRRSSATSLR